MNWVVKLERIDEAGNLESAIVGYVERPDLASAGTWVSRTMTENT